MRWRVQLRINCASDVWKFCRNWTSRQGEFNLAKYSNITRTIKQPLIPDCTSDIAWLFVYYQHEKVVKVFKRFVEVFLDMIFNASRDSFLSKYSPARFLTNVVSMFTFLSFFSLRRALYYW